jgi:hypothetical protein
MSSCSVNQSNNTKHTSVTFDFNSDNVSDIIRNISSTLNNSSSYDEILNNFTKINELKISYIKFLINKLINDNDLIKIKNDNLSPYLNYLLSIYVISFPQIKQHTDKYIRILNEIDNFNIHPMIFQMVFINLIHSSYICELCTNPSDIVSQSNIEKISNIQFEVELGMNIFISTFDNVDLIFKEVENFIGYNNVSSQPYSEYNIQLNNILNNQTDLDNTLLTKFTKLNYMLTHNDHLTEYNINEYYSELNNNLQNLDAEQITNKFDNDYKMLDNIMDQYLKSYLANYNYVKKFDAFSSIQINPVEFCKKNAIYYWFDYCSTLNGHIFDTIFKSFSGKSA